MKQMNLLRVGVLLVAALFVVGAFTTGGFAKYITGSTGNDTARVAMFGVELEVGGNSFAENYGPSVGSVFTGEYAVKTSVEGEDVVAPGTNSTEANASTTFGAKGVPEVAVAIDISMDNATDVFLAKGTYPDYTTIIGYYENGTPKYGNFTLSDDYYPIKYTLNQTESATGVVMEPVTGNLEKINKTVSDFNTTPYEALTDLKSTFELTWEWAYGSLEADAGNDKADTYLGMVATNSTYALKYDEDGETLVAATSGTDYSTNIAYDLSVQVVQLD